MDFSGSAFTPRLPCISAIFRCHTISWVYQSETVWAHSVWTYHWGLERTWQFDSAWDSPFQQNYEDLSHTHFAIPLGIAPDWWDDKKRNHKPMLPIYLRLDVSSNLSRAISCLRLSCHNFPSKECSGSVTNVTGTLFRTRSTFCWTVRINISSAFAHSTSLSPHLSMGMAQLIW